MMYFEELKIGMQTKTEPVTLRKDEMISFAKQYDNVPLHTDEAFASTTHFGQLIAPGMLSFLLVWAQYLEQDLIGDALLAGISQKVEWKKPVFAGDVLSGVMEITRLTDRNPKNGLAELTLSVFNQNGELVLIGITESIVKKGAPCNTD